MYFDVLLYVMYLMYRLVHHKLAGRSRCFQGWAKKPSRGRGPWMTAAPPSTGTTQFQNLPGY